jgi:uncharacterized membrane protein YkvA (DUF1232 family)
MRLDGRLAPRLGAGRDTMERVDDRRRFFVVTPGRTGSTLLATILADAGADFSIVPRDDWDTARGGWMEHPDAVRAGNHFRLAFERSPSKPTTLISKWIWVYRRAAGKRHLRQALEQAVYFKSLHLDLAIPFAIKLGYFPQVIVNYRPFGEHAVSFSQMVISWSADALAAAHNRTYRNSLLLVHSFGGCVVSYADLTDRGRTEWATSLGQITGLSAENLLASRDRRASADRAADIEVPIPDEPAQRSLAALEALSGRALRPSAQALRNWQRNIADRHAPAGVPIGTREATSPALSGERMPAFAILNRFLGRWNWIERLRLEAEAIWKSAQDRRIRWYIRAIVPAGVLAYFIAPIDPIPNRLLVIGHLDDVLVIALVIALFIHLIPASIKLQHRSDAAERRRRTFTINR